MENAGPTVPLQGLELCLKFADTVDWRTSNHAKDLLVTYTDLVNWSQRRGIIDNQEAKRLLETASKETATSEEILERAKTLREAIYRMFSGVAHGRRADAADVKILNEYLGKAMARMEVKITDAGYSLGWCRDEFADKMLYPVAKSAAELLTSEHLDRVRECANEEEGCGSMFIDYSKSHTKRWCSMDTCGNKYKSRTYYAKHGKPQGSKS